MPEFSMDEHEPGSNPFGLRDPEEAQREVEPMVHVFGKGFVCETDKRGFATPHNKSRTEIVVDTTEGFVPLWAKDTILRWRFEETSMKRFRDPAAAKKGIERLMGAALLEWGDAAPVKFTRRDDAWDFQVVMRDADKCTINGCVLASAFFPDAGQHELVLYPRLFEQNPKEQVDTLIHEIGHIFGLRHFFAALREQEWPSTIFGEHDKFTIMNYGDDSRLTDADRADLTRLYQSAWSGQLTEVNGTPIRLVEPFHKAGMPAKSLVVISPVQPLQPEQKVAYVRVRETARP